MKHILAPSRLFACVLVMALMACDAAEEPGGAGFVDPNPSTYNRPDSPPVLIKNVTVIDGLGGQYEAVDVLLVDGKINAVKAGLEAPAGADIIDGTGRVLTPGLVDIHAHYGHASMPYAAGDGNNWDVNEDSKPITPEVRADHGVWTGDLLLDVARAGGVTTFQILPGSKNVIAGMTVTLKNIPGAATVQELRFPGAPVGLKLACGENPKNFDKEGRPPFSRLGVVAMQRQAFADAAQYRKEMRSAKHHRDLGQDVLVAALDGAVKIHSHCYRAEDMAIQVDMAAEFGFKIAAFHHAVEAYKIADLLSAKDICSAIWADWWGYKWEALDGIPENAAVLEAAGACTIIHSDTSFVGQMLMVEAAKALGSAQRAGVTLTKAEALKWVTSNPAKALGLGAKIGSVTVGKNADVVLWSGDPFSIYSKADRVFIDGAEVYNRMTDPQYPHSDFMLGQPVVEDKP